MCIQEFAQSQEKRFFLVFFQVYTGFWEHVKESFCVSSSANLLHLHIPKFLQCLSLYLSVPKLSHILLVLLDEGESLISTIL